MTTVAFCFASFALDDPEWPVLKGKCTPLLVALGKRLHRAMERSTIFPWANSLLLWSIFHGDLSLRVVEIDSFEVM